VKQSNEKEQKKEEDLDCSLSPGCAFLGRHVLRSYPAGSYLFLSIPPRRPPDTSIPLLRILDPNVVLSQQVRTRRVVSRKVNNVVGRARRETCLLAFAPIPLYFRYFGLHSKVNRASLVVPHSHGTSGTWGYHLAESIAALALRRRANSGSGACLRSRPP
jgi:hypothetical protein